MALDLWTQQDIRNSLLAGISLAAVQPDPVLLAGMLVAFKHTAHSFGLDWQEVLDTVALPQRTRDWLLAVEQGEVLELCE